MEQIKIIKSGLGLPVGSVLNLNKSTGNYEFIEDERVVSNDSTVSYLNSTIITPQILKLVPEYFEVVNKEPIIEEYYITPLVFKAHTDPFEDDVLVLVRTDGQRVRIHKDLFESIFKVVE